MPENDPRVVLVTVERSRPAVRKHETMLTDAGYTVRYSATPSAYTREEMGEAWGLIFGAEFYPTEIFDYSPYLRIMSRNGTGLDNVDVEEATRRGCAVCYSPAVNHHAVADFTLGLIINLRRGIYEMSSEMRRGHWPTVIYGGIRNAVLGILGLGRIGKQVALRAKAFGMEVIANDIAPDHGFAAEHGVRMVDFEEMVTCSDIVTIHTPLTELTEGMIDAAVIDRMKDGVLIVNTGRGKVIDEEALAAALESGKVAGAGLDVFHEEPSHARLLAFDNVLASPHVAGNDEAALEALALCAIRNLLDVARGEWPEGCVNADALR